MRSMVNTLQQAVPNLTELNLEELNLESYEIWQHWVGLSWRLNVKTKLFTEHAYFGTLRFLEVLYIILR